MNILVTGGAGYIGSHTVTTLKNRGYSVTVYDNLSTGFSQSLASLGVNFIQADVTDETSLKKAMLDHKIQAVIHFAAKLNVAESTTKPLDYYHNNSFGVLNMVRCGREAGINKIVFSSTAASYGNNGGEGLISESTPTGPLNPYGHSKLMGEQILRDAEAAHGIRSVALRYFNVAGAADDGKNGQRTKDAFHLIHLASQAATGKRPGLKIFGTDYPTPDGTCIRDYIHVEDLADLHVLALEYLVSGGKTDVFNCGYGEGYSVKQVVEAVKMVSKVDFPVETVGRRPGDAASLVADSSKIREAFNWTPRRNNLELICRSAYLWEQTRLKLEG